MTSKTYIIAEAGVNHNGKFHLAKKLIDIAKKSGADAVKFQIFKSEDVVTPSAVKAKYQYINTGINETQLAMIKKLELNKTDFIKLKKYADNLNLDFLITAFDSGSLNFIIDKLKVKRLKIPSGEITNGPFILEHARYGLDIILSTGMANISEISKAISIIAFGYLNKNNKKIPSSEDLYNSLKSTEGKNLLKKKVTILHCTTEYPAPASELNLNAINEMRRRLNLQIGYSDHSNGLIAAIAAVALDVRILEKHFTISKNMRGPDHKASLSPRELFIFVKNIREAEIMMGNGLKTPSISEIKNMNIARKSIVALRNIKKGERFSPKNIGCKRPGNGITPMKYWNLINKKSKKNFLKDELIK